MDIQGKKCWKKGNRMRYKKDSCTISQQTLEIITTRGLDNYSTCKCTDDAACLKTSLCNFFKKFIFVCSLPASQVETVGNCERKCKKMIRLAWALFRWILPVMEFATSPNENSQEVAYSRRGADRSIDQSFGSVNQMCQWSAREHTTNVERDWFAESVIRILTVHGKCLIRNWGKWPSHSYPPCILSRDIYLWSGVPNDSK